MQQFPVASQPSQCNVWALRAKPLASQVERVGKMTIPQWGTFSWYVTAPNCRLLCTAFLLHIFTHILLIFIPLMALVVQPPPVPSLSNNLVAGVFIHFCNTHKAVYMCTNSSACFDLSVCASWAQGVFLLRMVGKGYGPACRFWRPWHVCLENMSNV